MIKHISKFRIGAEQISIVGLPAAVISSPMFHLSNICFSIPCFTCSSNSNDDDDGDDGDDGDDDDDDDGDGDYSIREYQ